MATPSKKNPELDRQLTQMFGVDRKASIRANICTGCQKPATEFRDDLSKKEFTISGLCQQCQNEVFGS